MSLIPSLDSTRTGSLRAGAAFAAAAALLAWAGTALADGHALPRTPSNEGARVYIVSPTDGAEVGSPLTVVFGLSGMGVAP